MDSLITIRHQGDFGANFAHTEDYPVRMRRALLARGGKALDVVEAAVAELEWSGMYVTRNLEIATLFNSDGMKRASVSSNQSLQVATFTAIQ